MKAVDAATELTVELKALISSGASLSVLDEKRVRAVADLCTDSHRTLEAVATNPFANARDPFFGSALQYHRAKALRAKRCLVSYLSWRIDKVTDAWWENRESGVTQMLNPAETVFMKEYTGVMVEYMMSFAAPLDLRAFTWRPPSCHLVAVSGKVECTFVSPLSGMVYSIYVGKRITLNMEEAEQLLLQDIVGLVEDEN